ncbi:branched-chain amino acid ABC transporter permease [Ottowia testudinis]|uniref:Branched-chain amino acid ABC transporter permease n=1 Tax=Ottowia testudinis TaxID=2816950 RepID=A0A975CJA1_9BURK|nr:branched-chain amino acid ABC transporter permease [Ottowia testudinis]QTD46012.1 branched-chain amino acid ABC transporter permease [Ottowia testudinis]
MKRSSLLNALQTPVLLSLLLAAMCLAVAGLGSADMQRTLTETLIRVVIVVGLYVFIGNSGLMSFGHVAFMCVGAYAAAWLMVEPDMKALNLTGLPDWLQHLNLGHIPATLAAAALAAALALLSGLVLMRLSGIAMSIATFALLAVVNVVYSNWETVTGGTSSVIGIPTPVNLWVALAWAVLVLLAAQLYSQSRWGLQLRALREDSVAARAAGVNLYAMALLAFVISAAIVGLGGALEAQFLGVVNPDAFYLSQTFLFIAMLVVGGSASLTGAVAGVLSLSLLVELLLRLEQGVALGASVLKLPSGSQEIVLGVVMVVMLVLRPRGLMGHAEFQFRKPLSA